MKAWRISQHGGLENLKRIELPSPVPSSSQVRIKVEAVGLNHMDLWVRKGVTGHRFPLPITPGCDISGVIESTGTEAADKMKVLGISLGAPVLLNPGVSCGICEACLGGFDPICSHYGIIGETQDGGCADFVTAPIENIVLRPSDLSATDAAALPIPFVTAWSMLTRKACLRPGEVVLIHAGGSGVSVASIQIAKLLGGVVITTVGSENKVSKAKALGADYVINYKKSSFREEVKKITTQLGKKGVHVVLDHIGGETFQESLKCLAWGGRLVTCGSTQESEVKINLKHLFFKNISLFGSTIGSKADLIRIVELVSQGKLKPVIDSVFKMEEYPKACEKLESREFFGKIVVGN